MARKKIVAGNWKMNKTPSEAVALVEELKPLVANENVDVVFCVPAIDIIPVAEAVKGTNIQVGAENMYFEESGAYTGEISPAMLTDAGVKYVVLGHSERREYYAETSAHCAAKAKRLFAADITPILCVGETEAEYDAGKTAEVVSTEIKESLEGLTSDEVSRLVIAYEPIWAIGTGKSADVETAEKCCKLVRETVKSLYDEATAEAVRIQYGGSVKPNNIKEYMACEDIDGALIGGASLKVDSFKELVDATK